jgi:hypothetical protein
VRSKNGAPWTTAAPFETAPAKFVPNIVKHRKPAKVRSQSGGAFLGSIALAIITLFAVGIGVFSYLRSEEAEARLLAYQKRYEVLTGERDKLQGSMSALAAKVGHAGTADGDALLKAVQTDLGRHGAHDNYPAQIAAMLDKLKVEKFKVELAEAAAEKQRKRAEMNLPAFQAQLKELQEVIEKKNKELLDNRGESHELLGALEGQVKDLQEKLQVANAKVRQMARDREVEVGKADQKIKTLTSAVRGLKEQKNAEEDDGANIRKETAAGSVLAVNSGFVTLNIGQDRGVQRGMMFRIFRPDALGQPGEEIATLEVLRMDERTSTCRIKTNDILKPIITGDLAFNHLLASGKGKGDVVALVGKLDIDDDGIDDGDRLERMIKEQGGSVDFRLYPDGRQRGKITTRTNWVVMDMRDEVSGSEEERTWLRRLFEIRKEATDFGIRIRDSKKFVKELGYRFDVKNPLP